MRRIVRIPTLVLIAVIHLYQTTLARALPLRCRFHPTCSEYAVQSLREFGVIHGLPRAAWRLARCGPWTSGGLDPVTYRSRTGLGDNHA